jgi:hypothetical protein
MDDSEVNHTTAIAQLQGAVWGRWTTGMLHHYPPEITRAMAMPMCRPCIFRQVSSTAPLRDRPGPERIVVAPQSNGKQDKGCWYRAGREANLIARHAYVKGRDRSRPHRTGPAERNRSQTRRKEVVSHHLRRRVMLRWHLRTLHSTTSRLRLTPVFAEGTECSWRSSKESFFFPTFLRQQPLLPQHVDASSASLHSQPRKSFLSDLPEPAP